MRSGRAFGEGFTAVLALTTAAFFTPSIWDPGLDGLFRRTRHEAAAHAEKAQG
jgi:hypothetical protein